MRRATGRAGWALAAAAGFGMGLPALHAQPAVVRNGAPENVQAQPTICTSTGRLAEIRAELAWLGNNLTFPCVLAARVEGKQLEVAGMVPDAIVRDHALRLAREASGLEVVDKLSVQPLPAMPPSAPNNEALCRTAVQTLGKSFPQSATKFQVDATATGQVSIRGSVSSYEEKLAISRRLSRLDGCTCVDNQLLVKKIARQGKVYVALTTDGQLLVPDEPPPHVKPLPAAGTVVAVTPARADIPVAPSKPLVSPYAVVAQPPIDRKPMQEPVLPPPLAMTAPSPAALPKVEAISGTLAPVTAVARRAESPTSAPAAAPASPYGALKTPTVASTSLPLIISAPAAAATRPTSVPVAATPPAAASPYGSIPQPTVTKPALPIIVTSQDTKAPAVAANAPKTPASPYGGTSRPAAVQVPVATVPQTASSAAATATTRSPASPYGAISQPAAIVQATPPAAPKSTAATTVATAPHAPTSPYGGTSQPTIHKPTTLAAPSVASAAMPRPFAESSHENPVTASPVIVPTATPAPLVQTSAQASAPEEPASKPVVQTTACTWPSTPPSGKSESTHLPGSATPVSAPTIVTTGATSTPNLSVAPKAAASPARVVATPKAELAQLAPLPAATAAASLTSTAPVILNSNTSTQPPALTVAATPAVSPRTSEPPLTPKSASVPPVPVQATASLPLQTINTPKPDMPELPPPLPTTAAVPRIVPMPAPIVTTGRPAGSARPLMVAAAPSRPGEQPLAPRPVATAPGSVQVVQAPSTSSAINGRVQKMLQQRIETCCTGLARNVQVEMRSGDSVVVRLKASNGETAQQAATRIMKLPELKPYQVSLEAQVGP